LSSHIRAVLLRKILDVEVLRDTLREMGINYTESGNRLTLDNSVTLGITEKGVNLNVRIREQWNNITVNQFSEELTRTYTMLLEEKIERLKLEEAQLKENEALEQHEAEENKARMLALKKERLRLEAVRRKEELDLKRQIEEKVIAIKNKAMKLGYQIKEEVKGKEKIMVLIRR